MNHKIYKVANLFYKLCLAGIKEDLINKNPEFKNQILEFVAEAPNNNLKYLGWQVNVLKKNENMYDIIDCIKLYNQHGKSKNINPDIYSYKPEQFKELYNKLIKIHDEKEAAHELYHMSKEDKEKTKLRSK